MLKAETYRGEKKTKNLFWEQGLDFELSPSLFFIINMSIYHSAVSIATFPSLAHETSLRIYYWCGEAKEALSLQNEDKHFIENQVNLFRSPQGSF